MDRRSFIESCTARRRLHCRPPRPGRHSRPTPRREAIPAALLVDERGEAVQGGQPAAAHQLRLPLSLRSHAGVPAGSGQAGTAAGAEHARAGPLCVARRSRARRSLVAFSAICAHQLVYPTRDVSFISFRKTRAQRGVQDELIHCCAEHSQYDPAHGAQVLSGPAPQPLCAVLLSHDPAGRQPDRLCARWAASCSTSSSGSTR